MSERAAQFQTLCAQRPFVVAFSGPNILRLVTYALFPLALRRGPSRPRAPPRPSGRDPRRCRGGGKGPRQGGREPETPALGASGVGSGGLGP